MKKGNLGYNVVLLIVLTLLLKCVGFLNKIAIASCFGTTLQTDIYYTASGFADSISSVLLASISVGVINIYINNKTEGNQQFISSLLCVVSGVMVIVGAITAIFSQSIAHILSPAYNQAQTDKLSIMIKLMSVTFPFQGAIAVYSAILQAEKKFTPVKMTGTITSLVSIVFVILLSNKLGNNALMLSYITSIVINTVLLFACSGEYFKFSISKIKLDKNLKRLFKLMLPLFIGTAAHEINLIIDKSISSGIASGAISALAYSSVLYLFIENVIINSIVTAFFPEITEKVSNNKDNEAAHSVQKILFFALYLLLPIVMCTVIFSEKITALIYMRGNFNQVSLYLTSTALKGYVIGLPFLAFRDICMHIFYAYGDTRKPVIINMIGVCINITLDIILSKYWGIFGITFSTAIANAFCGCCMFIQLRKNNKEIINTELILELVKLLSVNLFLCLIIFAISYYINFILLFIIAAIIGFILETILLIVLKSKNIYMILNILKRMKEK